MPSWKRSLYVIAFSQVIAATGFALFFPYLPFYVKELGTRTGLSTEFWAGAVFSAQGLSMMIASPFWGVLADRYGRKLMAERAFFGGSVVIFLMAFARSAEELTILRALQGLVTGTVAALTALAASTVPREEVGYAMGLMQSGFWIGISAGPLLGGMIADRLGYRSLFFFTSSLLLLGGLLLLLVVHEEFTPSAGTDIELPFGFLKDWWTVLRSPGVALVYLIRFLVQTGGNILMPFIPLFAAALLANSASVNTFTGGVVSISSAATVATTAYFGRLGDKIGHRKVLAIGALLSALFYFPQSLVTSGWQLLVLQALTGAATGAIAPSMVALLAKYVRPGMEGAVYGLDNSMVSASRAVAPMIGAWVVMLFGIRWTFAVTGAVFLVVAGVSALWLPEEGS